jgi:predicted AAA+ superfamily ATPase
MVFYHLKRKYKHADIYYCRAEKTEEVDFLLIDPSESKRMFQVSYNLDRLSTREREIRALIKVGGKLGLDQGEILTFDTEGKEKANWFGHTIQVTMTPAWKFFMNE